MDCGNDIGNYDVVFFTLRSTRTPRFNDIRDVVQVIQIVRDIVLVIQIVRDIAQVLKIVMKYQSHLCDLLLTFRPYHIREH